MKRRARVKGSCTRLSILRPGGQACGLSRTVNFHAGISRASGRPVLQYGERIICVYIIVKREERKLDI